MHFEPSDNHEALLSQAKGLYQLCVSYDRQRTYWKHKYEELTREMLTMDHQAIQAERDTNERLTDYVSQLEARISELEQQARETSDEREARSGSLN
jgi:small-conductance mechanosensitive channel